MTKTETVVSVAPVVDELERLYDAIAAAYFGGSLDGKRPVILVESRGRRKVESWYVPGVWEDSADTLLDALSGGSGKADRFGEIVIASESLSEDPLTIAAHLAREMLSHMLRIRGSRGTRWGYYGRAWQSYATEIGCRAEVNPDAPHLGWSRFLPGEHFRENIGPEIRPGAFVLTRQGERPVDPTSKNRHHKWSCGCTTVRCATRLDATCTDCGNPFAWAETFEPPERFNLTREDGNDG